MATQARGIKVDPSTARAAGHLLDSRARLSAARNGTRGAMNAEADPIDAELRGQLAGIDEALAMLWAATLEGGS